MEHLKETETIAKHSAEIKKNQVKQNIRQYVLLAILLLLVFFCFVERDNLKDRVTGNFFPDGAKSNASASVIGDHVIEQPFIAKSDSIGSIGIYFKSKEGETADGTIKLELIDADGEVVSETALHASLVTNGKPTKFLLGQDSTILNGNHKIKLHDGYRTYLKKGAQYTFRMTFTGMETAGKLDILLYEDAKANDNEKLFAVIDGTAQQNTCVYMYTKNDVFLKKTLVLLAAFILAALIMVLLPYRRIDAAIAEKTGGRDDLFSAWISRLMMLASPGVAYFIVQKYVEFDLERFIRHITSDPLKPALNLLIIGFVCWFIYTLTNSTRVASMLTVLLFSAFGFTNFMLIQFRNTPLVFTDLEQIGTAMQVASSYSVTVNRTLVWAVVLTVCWCVASMAPPRHRGLTLKQRIIPLVILIIWFGALWHCIFNASYIEDHDLRVSSFRPTESYYRNGCPLSFMMTWRYAIVRKPEGYSVKEIEEIAEKYPSDEADPAKKVSKKNPNVIVVMNESFTDLAVLGEIKTNTDYMPFYHSLSENAIKGTMSSSVYGGSTANSEFECLTGFSMISLPLQSVAFRSIIKEETPSFADYIKNDGYGGIIAFHPGRYNSYNRNVVYPLLGFEEHISKDDLENFDIVRDFVSDEYDYKVVEQEYEKFRKENPDAPFYIFNVTIQNHGGYGYNTGVVDAGIKPAEGEPDYEMEHQFMNLMKVSDDALKELIEYYSNVDEETVIVLFGDHQPKLDEEFYTTMKSQHEGISELEWSELMHQVPFMIWSNYDLGEEAPADGEELHLSANYISPYLKQLLGMPLTGFDKYLLEMREELPVITAIDYQDAEGNIYEPDEKSKYSDKLKEYAKIQYNGLIDYRNRVNSFFTLKQ